MAIFVLIASVVLALATHWTLARWLERFTCLPERLYRTSSIVGAALRLPRTAVIGVALVAPLVVFLGQASWSVLGELSSIRWLLMAEALLLAWPLATYDRNQYFDQDHLLDRALVVVLALFVCVHPAFLAASLWMTYLMSWQFSLPHPLVFSWTPSRLLLDTITMAVGGMLLVAAGLLQPPVLAGLLLVVHASSYFVPGLAKLRAGDGVLWWLRHNRLDLLSVSAWINGWRAGRSLEQVKRASGVAKKFGPSLAIFTLVVELGAVAMLASPTLAVLLLVGQAALHAGIFICSGICFWKWTGACLAMGAWLVTLPEAAVAGVFTMPFAIAAAIAVATSPAWCRPMWLGWVDAPLNNFYRFVAVGESGARYEIPRNFMAPYDIVFCQSRFHFLSHEPYLVGAIGCNTRRDARNAGLDAKLAGVCRSDASLVRSIKDEHGLIGFNDDSTRRFETFLKRYFTSLATSPRKRVVPTWLAAPQHILFGAAGELTAYALQEPVQRVEIHRVDTYFDGERVHCVHDALERVVEIREDAALERRRAA